MKIPTKKPHNNHINLVYEETEKYVFRKHITVCEITVIAEINCENTTEESFFAAVAPGL
jgi:hypothetical protein